MSGAAGIRLVQYRTNSENLRTSPTSGYRYCGARFRINNCFVRRPFMSIDPIQKHDLGSLKIDDHSRRGKTGKRLGLFAAGLGALVLLGGLLLAFKSQKPVVEVTTARPGGPATAEALLNASGYVTPRRRATVAAKVTGRVEQIYAEEGLHVKTGQVLATLDCSQPAAALASAKTDRHPTAAPPPAFHPPSPTPA